MQRTLVTALLTLAVAACGGTSVQPTPTVRPSATPTQTASPAPTATASPAPTALAGHELVYLARDRLPPVAVRVSGAGIGATAEARILSRLQTLFAARPPAGLFNTTLQARARPASVRIEGPANRGRPDLAVVDFSVPGGDWGIAGSAGIKAFVQQVVYTASEEPGIRRVLITENGQQAIIGGEGLVIDSPATREQVAGYRTAGSPDPMRMGGASGTLDVSMRFSVDSYAPALVRFVIDTGLTGAAAKGGMAFTLTPRANDETESPDLGKWTFVIDVENATTTATGTRAVGATPLRTIRTSAQAGGVRYELGLEDLRPWRAAILYEPLRLVVDIGGDPDAVSDNIALYEPRFGVPVRPGFTASGLIRAFEARFEYRVVDYSGTVLVDDFATASLGTSELWGTFAVAIGSVPQTGGTLEILLRSPRDGSVMESVQIPISR